MVARKVEGRYGTEYYGAKYGYCTSLVLPAKQPNSQRGNVLGYAYAYAYDSKHIQRSGTNRTGSSALTDD